MKIVFSYLILILLPSSLLGQTLEEMTLETNAWCYTPFLNSDLELSPEQFEFQESLLKEATEMIRHFKEDLGHSDKDARRLRNRACNSKLLQKLSSKQKKVYLQYSRFSAAGGGWNTRTLASEYTRKLLSLTKKQSLQIQKIHETSSNKQNSFGEQVTHDLKKNLTSATKTIDDILHPDQKKKKRALIGEPFDFENIFPDAFSQASQSCDSAKRVLSGELNTTSTTGVPSNKEVSFLWFCCSPKKLDVKPTYGALVELAACRQVAKELKLSADQKDVIALRLKDLRYELKGVVQIQQVFLQKTAVSDIIRFKVKKKLPDLDSSETEFVEMTTADRHGHELRSFFEELDVSQRKRLLQLFYRWIAETGGRFDHQPVADFHPGWVDYLKLDDQQMQMIEKVMEKLAAQAKALHVKRVYMQTVEPIHDYLKAYEILSMKQRELWKQETAPYSEVPSEWLTKIKSMDNRIDKLID
jgi:hypothetical protein